MGIKYVPTSGNEVVIGESTILQKQRIYLPLGVREKLFLGMTLISKEKIEYVLDILTNRVYIRKKAEVFTRRNPI